MSKHAKGRVAYGAALSETWTPQMRVAQAKRMKLRWTSIRRQNWSEFMLEDNPMHRPAVIKAHKIATVRRKTWYRHSDATRAKQKAAWTETRKAKHRLRMRKGSPQQVVMQQHGNMRRRGQPNKACKRWWKNLSPAAKRVRAERMSCVASKMIRRRGPNPGFVRGRQGYVTTRFGKLRYDSTWEKLFIEGAAALSLVTSVKRDFPIRYRFGGSLHTYLLDFCVKIKKRNPLLLEIKCPLYMHTDSTCAKICAAKAYAKEHGMSFCICTSRKQVRRKLKCLAT